MGVFSRRASIQPRLKFILTRKNKQDINDRAEEIVTYMSEHVAGEMFLKFAFFEVDYAFISANAWLEHTRLIEQLDGAKAFY